MLYKKCGMCSKVLPLEDFYSLKETKKQSYCKSCAKKTNNKKYVTTRLKKEVIGVIGDTHLPFDHKDYLGFVKETFKKFGVTKVIHIGDFVDNHAISRHVSEADGLGANDEYKATLKEVHKWTKAFPEVTLLIGNHDAIPVRQAKELGIPEVFMKDVKELWQLPEDWTVTESVEVNGVLYEHGIGSSGQYGAKTNAQQMGMSYVCGHTHAGGSVFYMSNPNKMWFGLNAGCGIDISSYAMRYGKHFKRKPTLGCGIVMSDKEAYFIPMT